MRRLVAIALGCCLGVGLTTSLSTVARADGTPPMALAPWVGADADRVPVRADRIAWRMGLEGVGSVGAAPSASGGMAAFVGIERARWSLDLEARADVPEGTLRADGTGARSSLFVGTLAPCMRSGPFAGCPLLSMGALSGEGTSDGQGATTFYSAAGLRGAFEAPLPTVADLRLRVHADGFAPLVRTTLRDRGEDVWTTPALFATAGVGLVGRFL
jgi:hypothetical protein